MRRARWSAAAVTLIVAWAAFATGLMAYALARESIGAGLLAAFATWQMCHVWSGVHRAG
jgi:uncharacterized membrane protein (DUF485 family)